VNRLLRLGVIAAAPWPLAYACSRPQLVRAYPRAAAVRVLYLGLYVATAVACAVLLPWLLVPFGVVAAVGALAGLWLMRTGAGRARGLPRGSLSLVPVRQFVDQDFLAKQVRRVGPISKTTWPTLGEPVVCVHGLRRSADLLREQAPRLGGVGIAFDPLIPAGFLRNMEPDDHRHYKRLFEQALTDEIVAARTPEIDAAVEEALAAIAASNAHGADPRPQLLRATVTAFMPLLLGVEADSPEGARAVELYEDLGEFVEFPSAASEQGRRCVATAAELQGILGQSARQALDALAAGVEPPPSAVSALARSHPEALDDPTVTGNLVFVLRTASVDVASLLHWILKLLGDHPEWCLRVREDDSDDLARRIVLETLRLHQSEFIQRRVLEPVEIDGYEVPAGWFVRLCVRESHRDPEVFEDPLSFDPDRFAGRRLSRYEYSPFGRLEHRCIGETLTIALATRFVSALSNGYDWSVAQDGPAEFNRYHWRPSGRFRVRLEPRLPV
jgi:cytochrome P450